MPKKTGMNVANMLPIQKETSADSKPPILIQKMHIKPLLNTKLIYHNLIHFDMAHYIDADRLRAEINRLIADPTLGSTTERKIGGHTALLKLVPFLDSLQQEQPEVDLEEEVKKYWNAHALNYRIGRVADLDFMFLYARHFYELGRKAKEDK